MNHRQFSIDPSSQRRLGITDMHGRHQLTVQHEGAVVRPVLRSPSAPLIPVPHHPSSLIRPAHPSPGFTHEKLTAIGTHPHTLAHMPVIPAESHVPSAILHHGLPPGIPPELSSRSLPHSSLAGFHLNQPKGNPEDTLAQLRRIHQQVLSMPSHRGQHQDMAHVSLPNSHIPNMNISLDQHRIHMKNVEEMKHRTQLHSRMVHDRFPHGVASAVGKQENISSAVPRPETQEYINPLSHSRPITWHSSSFARPRNVVVRNVPSSHNPEGELAFYRGNRPSASQESVEKLQMKYVHDAFRIHLQEQQELCERQQLHPQMYPTNHHVHRTIQKQKKPIATVSHKGVYNRQDAKFSNQLKHHSTQVHVETQGVNKIPKISSVKSLASAAKSACDPGFQNSNMMKLIEYKIESELRKTHQTKHHSECAEVARFSVHKMKSATIPDLHLSEGQPIKIKREDVCETSSSYSQTSQESPQLSNFRPVINDTTEINTEQKLSLESVCVLDSFNKDPTSHLSIPHHQAPLRKRLSARSSMPYDMSNNGPCDEKKFRHSFSETSQIDEKPLDLSSSKQKRSMSAPGIEINDEDNSRTDPEKKSAEKVVSQLTFSDLIFSAILKHLTEEDKSEYHTATEGGAVAHAHDKESKKSNLEKVLKQKVLQGLSVEVVGSMFSQFYDLFKRQLQESKSDKQMDSFELYQNKMSEALQAMLKSEENAEKRMPGFLGDRDEKNTSPPCQVSTTTGDASESPEKSGFAISTPPQDGSPRASSSQPKDGSLDKAYKFSFNEDFKDALSATRQSGQVYLSRSAENQLNLGEYPVLKQLESNPTEDKNASHSMSNIQFQEAALQKNDSAFSQVPVSLTVDKDQGPISFQVEKGKGPMSCGVEKEQVPVSFKRDEEEGPVSFQEDKGQEPHFFQEEAGQGPASPTEEKHSEGLQTNELLEKNNVKKGSVSLLPSDFAGAMDELQWDASGNNQEGSDVLEMQVDLKGMKHLEEISGFKDSLEQYHDEEEKKGFDDGRSGPEVKVSEVKLKDNQKCNDANAVLEGAGKYHTVKVGHDEISSNGTFVGSDDYKGRSANETKCTGVNPQCQVDNEDILVTNQCGMTQTKDPIEEMDTNDNFQKSVASDLNEKESVFASEESSLDYYKSKNLVNNLPLNESTCEFQESGVTNTTSEILDVSDIEQNDSSKPLNLSKIDILSPPTQTEKMLSVGTLFEQDVDRTSNKQTQGEEDAIEMLAINEETLYEFDQFYPAKQKEKESTQIFKRDSNADVEEEVMQVESSTNTLRAFGETKKRNLMESDSQKPLTPGSEKPFIQGGGTKGQEPGGNVPSNKSVFKDCGSVEGKQRRSDTAAELSKVLTLPPQKVQKRSHSLMDFANPKLSTTEYPRTSSQPSSLQVESLFPVINSSPVTWSFSSNLTHGRDVAGSVIYTPPSEYPDHVVGSTVVPVRTCVTPVILATKQIIPSASSYFSTVPSTAGSETSLPSSLPPSKSAPPAIAPFSATSAVLQSQSRPTHYNALSSSGSGPFERNNVSSVPNLNSSAFADNSSTISMWQDKYPLQRHAQLSMSKKPSVPAYTITYHDISLPCVVRSSVPFIPPKLLWKNLFPQVSYSKFNKTMSQQDILQRYMTVLEQAVLQKDLNKNGISSCKLVPLDEFEARFSELSSILAEDKTDSEVLENTEGPPGK